VLYVLQPLPEQVVNVLIIQGIVDVAPLLAAADQPHLPQGVQLMGGGGLTHPQAGSKFVHTQFVLGESGDDAHPRGVTERLEGLGQPDGGRAIEQPFLDSSQADLIGTVLPA